MRIAVVHSFYTARQPSGENAVVTDQVDELRRAGHEVLLVGRRTDDFAESRAYSIKAAATAAIGRGPSPAPDLRRFNPDIVHIHNTFPNWGSAWLATWGARSVVTLHNYRPLCSNGLMFRDGGTCSDCLRTPVVPAVRHKCYRNSAAASLPVAIGASPWGGLRQVPKRCARVIALNEVAVEVYERVLQRPVDLVPNFVRDRSTGGSPTNQKWVFVGRLGLEKGIDVLLEHWPEGELLDIVGAGPLSSHVEAVVSGRTDVSLLGLMERDALLELLGTYAGIVLPSMCAENLPTVILEALAAGIPAVLSDHIQAAGAMTKAGAAVTFSPEGGKEAIRGALRYVTENQAQMRAAARRLHGELYSPSAWLSMIEPIYASVAEDSRSDR